jgi:PAS domain S-box-containing protein
MDSNQRIRELKNIINKSPAIVFLWRNQEGWPVEFVSENVSTLGYSPNEFLSGKISFSNIIHPDDLVRVSKEVEIYSEEKRESFSQEYRIITKDGRIKWVDDRTWVRYDDSKNITHYQGIILDITKRKESESMFGLVMEQSLVGIFVLQDNKLKYANEKLAEITGYQVAEILNWKRNEFERLFHPDFYQVAREQADKKQRGDVDIIANYQFKGIKKSGEIFWAEIYSKSIIYKGRYADLGILLDISERKSTEIKLKNSEKKYKEAYMRENFYKDLFAHDMNNILHGITVSLEICDMLISEEVNNTELDEMIIKIDEQIARRVELIENVRKFSEISEGEWKLQKMNIYKILSETIKHIKRDFANKNLNIKVSSVNQEYFVLANELIIDIFENILINAIKHNENERIEIKVNIRETKVKETEKILIEFEDNGKGIPDNQKPALFQRGAPLKKNLVSSGMGLGLFLVKQVIHKYNGEINVSNRVKGDYTHGTRFSLEFPKEC